MKQQCPAPSPIQPGSSQLQLLNPSCKNKLIVKTVTWLKDSHMLFDYQFTKNIIKQEIKISLQPSFIFFYRNNAKSQIKFIKQSKMIPRKIQSMQLLGCFEIIPNKDKTYKIQFHQAQQFDIITNKYQRIGTQVSNNSGEYKNQGIYFIVRSLKDNDQQPKGFILKTGQKLKFGRCQFNITVVKQGDPNGESSNFFDYQEGLIVDQTKIYGEDDCCKICLSSQQNQQTGYFFCTPCDCYGSCSIVHFQCLYLWCKTKVKKLKQAFITQYNFDKFQCQICKKYFPRYVVKGKYKFDLLPIERPQKPYLVLSSIINTSQTQKNITLINYINQGIIKVGRNNTCDLRVVDISVSRQHATIQMRDGQFYVYDSKSKFGTIVSEPKFTLDVEKVKRGIQVGRSVLTFQLADKQWEKTSGSASTKVA